MNICTGKKPKTVINLTIKVKRGNKNYKKEKTEKKESNKLRDDIPCFPGKISTPSLLFKKGNLGDEKNPMNSVSKCKSFIDETRISKGTQQNRYIEIFRSEK